MKALNLHAVGDLRYEDVNLTEPNLDEATVHIKAVGICGSDIPRIFKKGTYHFPTIPGHEFSGIIEKAHDSRLIGQRVVVFPLIPCGQCSYCKSGYYELCNRYDYYGSRRDGGYAEYLNVKISNLMTIPDSLSYEEAAMCEPAAVALHALKRGRFQAMSTIAIWGIGPIGLLLGKWANALGAKNIVLVARSDIKTKAAQDFGFKNVINSKKIDPIQYIAGLTNGAGADICVEGTGNSDGLKGCLNVCKKMGNIVCMGNPTGSMTLSQNDYWAILRKQLQLIGTWNSSFADIRNDWLDTIQAMDSKKIDVRPLITHKFHLNDFERAFKVMRDKDIYSCKVMFINE